MCLLGCQHRDSHTSAKSGAAWHIYIQSMSDRHSDPFLVYGRVRVVDSGQTLNPHTSKFMFIFIASDQKWVSQNYFSEREVASPNPIVGSII